MDEPQQTGTPIPDENVKRWHDEMMKRFGGDLSQDQRLHSYLSGQPASGMACLLKILHPIPLPVPDANRFRIMHDELRDLFPDDFM